LVSIDTDGVVDVVAMTMTMTMTDYIRTTERVLAMSTYFVVFATVGIRRYSSWWRRDKNMQIQYVIRCPSLCSEFRWD